MPTTLHDPVSHVNERKSPEESAAPALSAAEQTRQSSARPVRSIDQIPLAYHPFFEALPADAFPYAVLTPTYSGFMRRKTQRLVCCLDNRLIILEKTFGAPKMHDFSPGPFELRGSRHDSIESLDQVLGIRQRERPDDGHTALQRGNRSTLHSLSRSDQRCRHRPDRRSAQH